MSCFIYIGNQYWLIWNEVFFRQVFIFFSITCGSTFLKFISVWERHYFDLVFAWWQICEFCLFFCRCNFKDISSVLEVVAPSGKSSLFMPRQEHCMTGPYLAVNASLGQWLRKWILWACFLVCKMPMILQKELLGIK